MSLTLYFHPLSSYCQKALIALYENDTPFTPHHVDLLDPVSSAAFKQLWPIGKFPVLRDAARDQIVPEASIIIEYLAQHHPGRSVLIDADPDRARQTRMRDRFFDLYVNDPMGRIVADRLRPEGKRDPIAVKQSTTLLKTALGMLDRDMAAQTWATGDTFGMADCAAAPALFYADKLVPLKDGHKHADAYLERLMARPSFARAVREAQPYMKHFPG